MYIMLKKLENNLDKKNKHERRMNSMTKEYSEKEYWEGKVPDELFEEYLKKYGYEYTPTDYNKIPSRY